MLVTVMYSLAALQQECAAHSFLIAEKLPGLSALQRKDLKASSRTYAEIAEKSKAQAGLLNACLHDLTNS